MEKTLKLNDIIKAKIAQGFIHLGVKRANRILIEYGKELLDRIAKKYRCLGDYVISIEQRKLYDLN